MSENNRSYKTMPPPRCNGSRDDCNNRDEHGRCIALEGLIFGKPCPFYKSEAETAPEDWQHHCAKKRGRK